MTGNNQINYVVFDVENISKALDSASDLIAYEAPEMILERRLTVCTRRMIG